MRVLVSGASGFVGGHVAGALYKAGYLVRGLVRKMPSRKQERLGVEYLDDIDINLLTTMPPQVFEDVDAIIHLVGIIREGTGNQTFERIHVDGTRNLLDAADEAGFHGQFIYVSALGAELDAPSEYARSKFAAEELVRGAKFPSTIFRPSLILGRRGEFVQQMRDLVLHGGLPIPIPMPFVPVPGDGETLFQPIAIGDLVGCLVKCLSDESTYYHTYEVGGATQVSFNEMVQGFMDRLDVTKPVVHVPLPILNSLAGIMEAILPKPPLTQDQLINLRQDNITQSKAVEQVFKILPLGFTQILDLLFPTDD